MQSNDGSKSVQRLNISHTSGEMLAEVKREIGMRYAVYTRKVKSGKMTEAVKRDKIGIMYDIKKVIEAAAAQWEI